MLILRVGLLQFCEQPYAPFFQIFYFDHESASACVVSHP